MVVFPLRVVNLCVSDSWRSVGQQLEQLRNGTGSFPVCFSWGCFVAVTWFFGGFPLVGDVWLATSGIFVSMSLWVSWVVCIVGFVVKIFKLYWNIEFSWCCCQTTSGIGGSFAILVISGLSNTSLVWMFGLSSLKFGLQLGHSHLNCFERLFVWPGSVLPVVCFEEAV